MPEPQSTAIRKKNRLTEKLRKYVPRLMVSSSVFR